MYKMSSFSFLSVLSCAFGLSAPYSVSAQDVTAIRTRAVVDVLNKTIVENAYALHTVPTPAGCLTETMQSILQRWWSTGWHRMMPSGRPPLSAPN